MPAHLLSFGYDPLIMGVRSMLLRTDGYRVTEVLVFREALRLITEAYFDMVLLCHTVPEEQRAELMGRAADHDGNMPVLCLSTNPGIRYSKNCETASNTAPELLLQIEEALQKSRERRAA